MKKIKYLVFLAGAYLYALPEANASTGEPNLFKFVFGVANFVIFSFVIYKFGFKKLVSFFVNRGEQVEKDVTDAAEEKTQALVCYEDLHGRLENISKERDEMFQNAKERGSKLQKDVVGVSERRAENIIKEGKLLAERESEKAQTFLKKTLMDMSIGMAEEKIKKELDSSRHAKLIDACIKQLESM